MATTRATPRADRRRRRSRCRALAAAILSASLLLAGGGSATAQSTWRIVPTLGADVTFTNNVNLSSRETRESDAVFLLSPGFSVDYRGSRANLQGSVAVPVALYARTGDANNRAYPSVALRGELEAVEDHFFIDASANVSQTYFSPFGARPEGLTNATDNRYTFQTYVVSPYLQGNIGSDIRWSIRNDNTWTTLNDTPEATDDQYINRLFATINRQPLPLGWGVDVDRTAYRFSGEDAQVLALARLRGVWRLNPQFEVFASAGYEDNRFPLFDSSGAIYGGGLRWRPTERTTLDASWEHRFFGESYNFLFEHRRPLSFWSVRASRNLSSYPELLARLPEGAFVPGILNQILQNRITDPAERGRFIAEYMASRGLPTFLGQPISVYTQQLYLYDYAGATAGLFGTRNSVFMTVFRSRQQPITGSGAEIPPSLSPFDDNTQYGANVVWSYQLSPFTTFSLSGDAYRSDAEPPFVDRTDQYIVRGIFTRPISPNTNAYVGARWQSLNSNVDIDWREAAVFAGVSHSFR